MYIYFNPFLAGVLFTIGLEIVTLFVAACVAVYKKGKRYGNFR
jgi:hypothetical protein